MTGQSRLTLLKQDGKSIDNIYAVIDSTTMVIFIPDDNVPIEEGDILQRKLPSGLLDGFTVTDSGYDSFPKPHYRAKYIKTSQIPEKTSQITNYNFQGDNSRVYNNSTDSSINISGITISTKFTEIRETIKTIPDNNVHPILLAKLDELQASIFTASHRKTTEEFIEIAAKCTTILAPYFPYLRGLFERISS